MQEQHQDWLWGLSLSGIFGAQVGSHPRSFDTHYDPQSRIQADFVSDSFHPRVKGQQAYAAAFESAHGHPAPANELT